MAHSAPSQTSIELSRERTATTIKGMLRDFTSNVIWLPDLGSMIVASELVRRRSGSQAYSAPDCGVSSRQVKHTDTTVIFGRAVLRAAIANTKSLELGTKAASACYATPCAKEEAMRMVQMRNHYHQVNGCIFAWNPGRLWITEAPTVSHRNKGGSYHSENGPALAWANGFEIYMIDGTVVPKNLVMNPEKLTLQDILEQRNAEVVRVMLEKMSVDTFLKITKGKIISEDRVPSTTIKVGKNNRMRKETFVDVRKLIKIEMPKLPDRQVKFVLVECPSTGHKALLGVPPSFSDVKQAVDWTENKPNSYLYEMVLET